MDIILRSPDSLVPYARNPRVNDRAVDAVAASLKEFGFRQAIVIDDQGVIVVGHVRWKAAVKLGLARVPVHVAAGLTPDEVTAYRIADNQTASLADWDMDLLPDELRGLELVGYDLSLLGFKEEDLVKLLEGEVTAGLTDPDNVPAPPDKAITKRGDLWVLGGHRLLCGDAGSEDDVGRLLDGATVHLVNMDPPYNVRHEPRTGRAIAAGRSSYPAPSKKTTAKKPRGKLRPRDRALANDSISEEAFAKMVLIWFATAARFLKPGGSFYIWAGYSNLANYPVPLKAAGLYFSQSIVWDKRWPVLSRKDFMSAFEMCFYGWKKGAAHHFYGPNNAIDLWHVRKVPPQEMIHLTEKPVELAVRSILYSSKPGQNVLDLFAGSGSSLIACQQTDRRAFLTEVDPLYCDVIVRRYEEFTGQSAEKAAPQSSQPTKQPASRSGPKKKCARRKRSS